LRGRLELCRTGLERFETGYHIAVGLPRSCCLLFKVIARIIVGIEIETSVDVFVRRIASRGDFLIDQATNRRRE
jgi:hypothetical protein